MTRVLASFALLIVALLAAESWAQTRDLKGEPSLRRILARERAAAPTIWGPGQYRVGHVHPGAAYDYGPFHLGTVPLPDPNNDGVWDWDTFNAPTDDSLQGWWPIRRKYSVTGGLTLTDAERAWDAIDIGNQGNYVLNSRQQPRTFGVISYWHVDAGKALPGPASAIQWAPLAGAASAWCGLRAHGDLSYTDGATGNPYNADVLDYNGENGGGTGTNKHFPGYASQWDQMLYRDVVIAAGAKLDLSFLYATKMSTAAERTPATRIGWFNFDPSVNPANDPTCQVSGPNFGIPDYYANRGNGLPCDSFMVYIGAPVDVDSLWLSDGQFLTPGPGPHAVYDLQRRWFSEVLDLSKPIIELMHVAGDNNNQFTRSGYDVSAIYNSQTTTTRYLRIVFRSKTNRGSDDESGGTTPASYNSGGEGAVRIDDVSLGGVGVSGPATIAPSGFESPGEIDNTPEANPSLAIDHWHATGKPPTIYFHPHPLAGGDIGGGNFYTTLTFQDLCGASNSSQSFCNMSGIVISTGDHDQNESTSGPLPDLADRERMSGMVSPTINLKSNGPANGMGITQHVASVSGDYYVVYDVHRGGVVYGGTPSLCNQFNGSCWTFGFQSYPARQSNGIDCWGEIRYPEFQLFDSDSRCLQDFEGANENGLIRSSNPDFTPDSIRIFLGQSSQSFRFSVGSSSTDFADYFDNVSLVFADAPPAPEGQGAISVDIGRWLNDAFPFSTGSPAPVSNIDTLAAFVKTGINFAQGQQTLSSDPYRPVIAGDSIVVVASNIAGRVDMVFRIKPGPGNYHIVGNVASGLRPVPTDTMNIVTPCDGSFWGQYMCDPGEMSKGVHGPGNTWNPNVWNSARVDTAEINIFPVQSNLEVFDVNSHFLGTYTWMATYSESDPKYAVLGIPHNICFLANPDGPVNSSNIVCGPGSNVVPNTYPPAWATTAAGFDGQTQTKEGTKIIPDGLLTPGSHVEYFFRNSELASPSVFTMCPDTNIVSPQNTEGPSVDGHRWQEYSVLPDRWKDPLFGDPGAIGMACMLFVDVADRRGDERVWISVADSIGGTKTTRWGANNGWRARADQSYTDPVTLQAIPISGDPTIAVYTHGGQAGTTWDKYDIKAGEAITNPSGGIGSSFADPATGFATGKDARIGPGIGMLQKYYRILLILTGDLNVDILGPFRDRGDEDVVELESFMSDPSPSGTTPRAVLVAGDGFVESENGLGQSGYSEHSNLLTNYFGVILRTGNPGASFFPQNEAAYQVWSGDLSGANPLLNLNPYSDLTRSGPFSGVYRAGNACLWGNDVLLTSSGLGAVASDYYDNIGTGAPYIAGVFTPIAPPGMPSKFYESMVEGIDIRHLFGRHQPPSNVNSYGRLEYFFKTLTTLQASLMCQVQGTPIGEAPDAAPVLFDFLGLQNNPLRTGVARIHLGLAKADRVQVCLYDISGRLIRTLADRNFAAGDHDLVWDGTDDRGIRVARGVYFARARYRASGFTGTKHLVLLK